MKPGFFAAGRHGRTRLSVQSSAGLDNWPLDDVSWLQLEQRGVVLPAEDTAAALNLTPFYYLPIIPVPFPLVGGLPVSSPYRDD